VHDAPEEEAAAQVDALIAAVEKRGPFPKNRKKILLTGSDVTYPSSWTDRRVRVPRRADDLSVGERTTPR